MVTPLYAPRCNPIGLKGEWNFGASVYRSDEYWRNAAYIVDGFAKDNGVRPLNFFDMMRCGFPFVFGMCGAFDLILLQGGLEWQNHG